jgi:ATP/maltotriose-dependent transcriptional regulator MalT
MSAPSVERPRVIRRKIIVPDTPVGAVPRERLDGLLCQLVDAHRVVAVTATAGAGKSVAVAHASRKFKRPVAWLSVDATDAAPGRLVTYLEEATSAPIGPERERALAVRGGTECHHGVPRLSGHITHPER